jgi:hypothetical protein
MAQLDSAQFEALWQSANTQPVSPPAAKKQVQIDLSLGSFLDKYLAMVATHRDSGRVSKEDFDALASAISDLKVILTRINDADLVAAAKAQNAQTLAQQTGGQGSSG